MKKILAYVLVVFMLCCPVMAGASSEAGYLEGTWRFVYDDGTAMTLDLFANGTCIMGYEGEGGEPDDINGSYVLSGDTLELFDDNNDAIDTMTLLADGRLQLVREGEESMIFDAVQGDTPESGEGLEGRWTCAEYGVWLNLYADNTYSSGQLSDEIETASGDYTLSGSEITLLDSYGDSMDTLTMQSDGSLTVESDEAAVFLPDGEVAGGQSEIMGTWYDTETPGLAYVFPEDGTALFISTHGTYTMQDETLTLYDTLYEMTEVYTHDGEKFINEEGSELEPGRAGIPLLPEDRIMSLWGEWTMTMGDLAGIALNINADGTFTMSFEGETVGPGQYTLRGTTLELFMTQDGDTDSEFIELREDGTLVQEESGISFTKNSSFGCDWQMPGMEGYFYRLRPDGVFEAVMTMGTYEYYDGTATIYNGEDGSAGEAFVLGEDGLLRREDGLYTLSKNPADAAVMTEDVVDDTPGETDITGIWCFDGDEESGLVELTEDGSYIVQMDGEEVERGSYSFDGYQLTILDDDGEAAITMAIQEDGSFLAQDDSGRYFVRAKQEQERGFFQ